MKPTSPIPRALRAACALFLALPVLPAMAGWESYGIETKREAFNLADADRNGNIDPAERDRLRLLFDSRSDLKFIDRNRNLRLEREEIDELELEMKAQDRRKRDAKKKAEDKEKEREREKRKKKRKI